MLHALEWSREHERYEPDSVALLAPTTPLRTARQIDDCVDLRKTSGLDTAVTATSVHNHPYFIYTMEDGCRLREIFPVEGKAQRRQDVPTFYGHSQAVIATRRAYFDRADDETPVINFASMVGLVIDREIAWDIDSPLDWMITEQLVLMRRTSPEAA